MTDPARKTYDRIADLPLLAKSTQVEPTARLNTLGHESTVLAGLRELAEDTRLLEGDIEKYRDAPSSSFRDLDATE